MTTFYANNLAMTFRSPYSKSASSQWKLRLGSTYQHIRVGRFHCVVGNREMIVGDDCYTDEPVFIDTHPYDRLHRLELLDIVEQHLAWKNPMHRRLSAAIAREREQHSKRKWFVKGPKGRMMLDLPSTTKEADAIKKFLKSIGKARMPRNTSLSLEYC